VGKLRLPASALLTSTFRFEGAACCIEGAAVAGRAAVRHRTFGMRPKQHCRMRPLDESACVEDGQSPVAMAASSFSHKREIIAVVLPHSQPWA
jgi:hypothetical protein